MAHTLNPAAQLQQLCNYLNSGHSTSLDEVKHVITQLDIKPTYPIILVGGTNGKGSTCAFLSTILTNAGYRVGCFTSPHVFKYNERITINNQPLSDHELISALEQIIAAAPINLGLFKTFTLASHLVFKAQQIDIAIIEVGIGGRHDVTNLFEPTVAAITTVGLDHCEILGATVDAIGSEKAHIYRPGQAAFYGDTLPPPSVIAYAQQIHSRWNGFGSDFGYRRGDLSWDFYAPGVNYYSLPFPSLRGTEQLKNACLALAILAELRNRFPLSLTQIKSGLLQTSLVGRFQVLPGTPQIILDTAHNPQAVEALLKNMLKLPFAKRNCALIGIAANKDWQQILKLCLAHFQLWFLTELPSTTRAVATTQEMTDYLISHGVKAAAIYSYPYSNSYQDSSAALIASYQQLATDERLVCFGSFLTVEAAYLAVQQLRA